ncbi:hypothetical protein SDC9_75378 [bioreactor metagenome]|uniref:Uncharacterized protein n=1 Tax=bioreactor metagenome TaxID=1076179 RepID=A0A644YKL6_9ZZZZ
MFNFYASHQHLKSAALLHHLRFRAGHLCGGNGAEGDAVALLAVWAREAVTAHAAADVTIGAKIHLGVDAISGRDLGVCGAVGDELPRGASQFHGCIG